MYTRIVVPLDGSKLAERALSTAEELARLMKAPLHLLRVVDTTQLDLGNTGLFDAVLNEGSVSPADYDGSERLTSG